MVNSFQKAVVVCGSLHYVEKDLRFPSRCNASFFSSFESASDGSLLLRDNVEGQSGELNYQAV